MEIIWIPFKIIINILGSITSVYLMNGVLGCKYERKIKYISSFLICVLQAFLIIIMDFCLVISWYYQNILLTLFLLAYALIFLNGTIYKKLLITIINVIILNSFINVIISIVSILSGVPLIILSAQNDSFKAFVLILIRCMHFFLSITIVKLSKKNKNVNISEWVLIIFNFLIAALSMVLCFDILSEAYFSRELEIKFTIIQLIIIIMSIVTYLIFRYSSTKQELDNKASLREQKASFKRREIKAIIENYKETNTMRHDMDNNLLYLYEMLESKHYDQAKEYLKNLRQSTQLTAVTYIECDNIPVASLLNVKIGQAKECGIDVKCFIAADLLNFDNSIELCGILSNLIDNAIDATVKITAIKKCIIIQLKQHNTYIQILITNPIEKSVLLMNPNLATTKPDKKIHGFGRMITERYVKKLKGNIAYWEEDNTFNASVIIPITDKQNSKS